MMEPPKVYVAPKVSVEPRLDGLPVGPGWDEAPWSDEFVDIEGNWRPHPRFKTRMKMAWNEQMLFIGAELEEPHVWGTLTEHDSVIFQDNDFELFLDPDGDGHRYVELEINALNTTWDLLLARPYRAGGPPIDGFELAGLVTAVHVDGTLNDASDIDRSWSVTIGLPWKAVHQIAGTACPPLVGDQWRINFSRVQWKHEVRDGTYVRESGPEDNWVWSPMDVIDMHRPERWGAVQFGESASTGPINIPGWRTQRRLTEIWEFQQEFKKSHGRFGTSIELGINDEGVEIHSTPHQFAVQLNGLWIDQELRIQPII